MNYFNQENQFTSICQINIHLFIALTFITLFSASSHSETLKLTTVDWQPFYGHNLPEKGFFSVIAREAFKHAGYEIEIEFQPWKRALESTKKGQFDGLLGAYFNKDRTEYLIYTDEVFENRDVFIGKNKQLVAYQDLSELKTYRIGTIRASAYSDELKDKGFTVVDVNDDMQSLRMLLKDRIDLVLMSQTHFQYLLEQDLELFANRDQLSILDKPFRTYSLYCPIRKSRKDSKEIVSRFNDALNDIKKNGTFDKILTRFNLTADEG